MRLQDPSTLPRGPRRFVAYWLRDMAAGFDSRGWWAFMPLTLIICITTGVAVGYFADGQLWSDLQNAIAFYAAGLAVNSILLAVCWASFARIFDTLADPDFGAWMRHRQLDGLYGFYVDYIQASQMAAVVCMGTGLLLSLVVGVPDWIERSLLGAAVASSLYAMRWTGGCVRIMRDLSEHHVTFRSSPDQVMPLRNQDRG